MGHVKIRPFLIADYDEVLALWQSVEGVGINDADSCENMTRFFERNPGLSFVATCDDTIVGAVICGHDGRRGYLNHLAVSPDYRRQGIGGRLVENCLAGLKAVGIQRCNIMVFNDNRHGIAFWRACGYAEQPWVILQRATSHSD